ncbi:MAG: folate-binding protein YgfZ [Lentimonas sp.]|jgi:folate-binding protein YgfZ
MEAVIGYTYRTCAHLEVSDEDAADFLQSQFTNELRPFEPGTCSYGLWLDVKGKVIGDSRVLCEGAEQFRILSATTDGAVIQHKLQRHIIADDVEIELQDACLAYSLIGVGVVELLQQIGYPTPAVGRYCEHAGVLVYSGRRSIRPSFELVVLDPSVADSLAASLTAAGVDWVDEARIQRERLEAGYPLIPTEIGSADLPGEGGLVADAVSLTKGCYLGQEVVARMHNLGRPQRGLFLVQGSGAIPALPTALHNADKKVVGELRSAYPLGGDWQGGALLKLRFAQAGDQLSCGAGAVSVIRAFRSELKGGE